GHDEHFGAGFGQTLDNLGSPYVFADRNSQTHAAEIYWPRHRARRENTLFVEHTVVGKIDFVADCSDCAAVEQRHCVVKLVVIKPWRPDQQRRTRRCRFERKRFDRRAAFRLKRRFEHQILRRITGNKQLRKDDHVGTSCDRARTLHLFDIAGKVTNSRVELRNRDCKLARRTSAHGKSLPLCQPARQWAGLQSCSDIAAPQSRAVRRHLRDRASSSAWPAGRRWLINPAPAPCVSCEGQPYLAAVVIL